MPQIRRCWPSGDDPLMDRYHDEEWGVPARDDRRHFEYLLLDAFQAGLSWRTVLHKRENFRRAFAGFDPARIARFGDREVKRLLADAGIKETGSFDRYVWQFTGGLPIRNAWRTLKELPPRSEVSDAMSADLKKRGFTFVGSTICYAYMQAAGLVNDHLVGCPRRLKVGVVSP